MLKELVGKLHGSSSRGLNLLDNTPGRKVWHEYRDTRITYRKSYLSRLNYVNQNPVKHGAVLRAEEYRWCSAGWYQAKADDAFKRTLASFKIDTVRVPDDF